MLLFLGNGAPAHATGGLHEALRYPSGVVASCADRSCRNCGCLRLRPIQDGGFESPNLCPYGWTNPGLTTPVPGANDYIVYPYPTLDGWTYSSHAGLINAEAGSDTYGPVPPPGFGGDQFAAVQLTGSLSQYFASPGGELTLSWLEAGRPNLYGTNGGDETYAVEVDGVTVGTFATFSDQPFTPETLTLTNVSVGLHNLIFQGLTTTGDETSFFDNVAISTAQSPASRSPQRGC